MNLPDWATVASGVVAIGAVFFTIAGRAAKHWIAEQLTELKPNGGGSTYDIVRKVARETERAADAAEKAADSALEVHAHLEDIANRVSSLEQVIVAWTPKKATSTRKIQNEKS
jgi:hypothetical protein